MGDSNFQLSQVYKKIQNIASLSSLRAILFIQILKYIKILSIASRDNHDYSKEEIGAGSLALGPREAPLSIFPREPTLNQAYP